LIAEKAIKKVSLMLSLTEADMCIMAE